jgi:DNA invertase Pin-like site-specific DNA recombinase
MQFLYARVSTSDQTAAHQLEQARAAELWDLITVLHRPTEP